MTEAQLKGGALVAVVAVALGCFAPWQSAPFMSWSGIEGDGKYSLGLTLTAGLLILANRAGAHQMAGAALLAAASALVAGINIAHVLGEPLTIFGRGVDVVHVGWGLWLSAAGSAILTVPAALLWVFGNTDTRLETKVVPSSAKTP